MTAEKGGRGGERELTTTTTTTTTTAATGIHLDVCVCCYDNPSTDGTLSLLRSLSAQYEDGGGVAAA